LASVLASQRQLASNGGGGVVDEAAHQRPPAGRDRRPGRPVSAIAYSCGFGDLSGFNRAFKQAYAVSPNELRNASASATESAPSMPGGPGHG
jgi:AraC-like DNA-binding protein